MLVCSTAAEPALRSPCSHFAGLAAYYQATAIDIGGLPLATTLALASKPPPPRPPPPPPPPAPSPPSAAPLSAARLLAQTIETTNAAAATASPSPALAPMPAPAPAPPLSACDEANQDQHHGLGPIYFLAAWAAVTLSFQLFCRLQYDPPAWHVPWWLMPWLPSGAILLVVFRCGGGRGRAGAGARAEARAVSVRVCWWAGLDSAGLGGGWEQVAGRAGQAGRWVGIGGQGRLQAHAWAPGPLVLPAAVQRAPHTATHSLFPLCPT